MQVKYKKIFLTVVLKDVFMLYYLCLVLLVLFITFWDYFWLFWNSLGKFPKKNPSYLALIRQMPSIFILFYLLICKIKKFFSEFTDQVTDQYFLFAMSFHELHWLKVQNNDENLALLKASNLTFSTQAHHTSKLGHTKYSK